MHGLLLRSIQAYTRSTFGPAVWGRVLLAANQPPEGFEPMLSYGQDVLGQVTSAVAAELGRSEDSILEDLGTFLVTDPGHRALRRLLRFGGATFEEFLHSLEELPDRARLALPDIDMPQIDLTDRAPGVYCLRFTCEFPAFFPVAVGALRAMADDYGALVLIDPDPSLCGTDQGALTVQLLSTAHGEGRRFDLAASGADHGW